MKKRILTMITIAAVLSGTVSAMAEVKFSDIDNVPWEGAKTYIQNVADIGLMVGESDGKGENIFRARDNVTYCETIQLIYNLLKNADVAIPSESITNKWQAVLRGYGVPSWAYESVAYAIENDIVTTSQVKAFMADSNGRSINATRQDVAIIFGKGLSSLYDVEEDVSLAYNDSKDITDTAAPYVNMLSKLNILVGDSNKNFNPKVNINRAEMAVMVSKTNSVLNGENISDETEKVTGSVIDVSVGADGIKTVTVSVNNSNMKFKGDSNTPVSYEGKTVSFMDITAGDNVTIEYKGDEIINIVLNFDFLDETGNYVTGTVNYMSSERITVNLANGSSAAYDLASTAYITLNGSVAKVSDITAVVDNGVDVSVKILTNGNNTALSVEATGEKGIVKGKITEISRTAITIKRRGGGNKEYKFASDVVVRYDGSRAQIADIIEAVEDGKDIDVTVSLNSDGKISEIIAVINTEGGTVWGVVKNVSTDKITLLSGSSTVSYNYADGLEATLDGSPTTVNYLDRLNENGKEFSVTLYLNSSGKVVKIAAVLEDATEGKINNVTKDYIEIVTDYGKTYKYYFASGAKVKFSGSSKESIQDLIDVYEKGVTEVKLEFNSSDLVTRVVAYVDWKNFETASGSVDSATTSSITVGGTKYTMDSNTTVYINGTKAVAYDVYDNSRNAVDMVTDIVSVDGYAKKLDVTVTGAEGTISGMENGYITIKTATRTTKYPVAKGDTLIVRINGATKEYTFNDLYDRWNNLGQNFDVTLKIKDGTVIKITAVKQ